MLFDLKEFEHAIEEPELKKGLKLFTNNKLEILNKTGNSSFSFLVDSKPAGEIFVQIKAGKISNYKCFCDNKSYCSHLASVIFYLQKEVFELVTPAIKKNKTQNNKSSIENHLKKIKHTLKPFLEINKLKAQQINEICKKVDIETENAIGLEQQFYFDLAIILELPKLLAFNFSEKENKLYVLFDISKQKIKYHLAGKLTNKEKEAIVEAAEYSVRSQANFRTGIFSFLISYASVLIKDKNEFDLLKSRLKKRSLNKNRLDQTDRKLIAELQLSIMHAKLLNKNFSLKKYSSTIELPIALAELEFCKKNDAKGFNILKQSLVKLKKNTSRYLDLVEEVLRFAKEKNNRDIEKEYLQEKFIYSYFIDEKELNYFFELNKNKSKETADELLARLKTESLFYTFDKLAVLLMNQNRLNDLVQEIKKEKNKFRILNIIADKIFPDNEFIKLYVKHLSQAIIEAKFPYFQEQVFNLARTYIDGLPLEPRMLLLKLSKEKMMYERQFLLYLNKIYPTSF